MTNPDPVSVVELLRRVEAADGPDREVDEAIAAIFGADVMRVGTNTIYSTGPYTASIDAALALVERKLPGWWCQVSNHGRATVQRMLGAETPAPRISANAATAPLAIIAALLKALTK